MTAIKETFGAGGVGIHPNHGSPDLADTLRDIADDLADVCGVTAAWSTGITVTAHSCTLSRAGVPVAVEATTATAAGAKAIQYSASPAAGHVRVQFTNGVATLTFNATDAVTVCAVLLNPMPATIRTTKAS